MCIKSQTKSKSEIRVFNSRNRPFMLWLDRDIIELDFENAFTEEGVNI